MIFAVPVYLIIFYNTNFQGLSKNQIDEFKSVAICFRLTLRIFLLSVVPCFRKYQEAVKKFLSTPSHKKQETFITWHDQSFL